MRLCTSRPEAMAASIMASSASRNTERETGCRSNGVTAIMTDQEVQGNIDYLGARLERSDLDEELRELIADALAIVADPARAGRAEEMEMLAQLAVVVLMHEKRPRDYLH